MVLATTKEKQRKFSKFQREARENPTPSEKAVKTALDTLGVRYVFQKGFLRDKTLRLVDFYIPKSRFGRQICLEVDGGYHENQKGYDAYRESRIALQRAHIKFVRVQNAWVLSQDNLPSALDKVLSQS